MRTLQKTTCCSSSNPTAAAGSAKSGRYSASSAYPTTEQTHPSSSLNSGSKQETWGDTTKVQQASTQQDTYRASSSTTEESSSRVDHAEAGPQDAWQFKSGSILKEIWPEYGEPDGWQLPDVLPEIVRPPESGHAGSSDASNVCPVAHAEAEQAREATWNSLEACAKIAIAASQAQAQQNPSSPQTALTTTHEPATVQPFNSHAGAATPVEALVMDMGPPQSDGHVLREIGKLIDAISSGQPVPVQPKTSQTWDLIRQVASFALPGSNRGGGKGSRGLLDALDSTAESRDAQSEPSTSASQNGTGKVKAQTSSWQQMWGQASTQPAPSLPSTSSTSNGSYPAAAASTSSPGQQPRQARRLSGAGLASQLQACASIPDMAKLLSSYSEDMDQVCMCLCLHMMAVPYCSICVEHGDANA